MKAPYGLFVFFQLISLHSFSIKVYVKNQNAWRSEAGGQQSALLFFQIGFIDLAYYEKTRR